MVVLSRKIENWFLSVAPAALIAFAVWSPSERFRRIVSSWQPWLFPSVRVTEPRLELVLCRCSSGSAPHSRAVQRRRGA
jgi:hypothetical protein